MGQHHRPGARRDGCLDLGHIDVVGDRVDIDKDRDRTKLHDGIHGRRKARGHANDLVAPTDGAVAEFWRGEGREGNQVGRRARVDGEQVLHADEIGKALLKRVVEAPGGEPAIERGIDHGADLGGTDHLARWGNHGLPGDEGAVREGDASVLLDQRANLGADLLGAGRTREALLGSVGGGGGLGHDAASITGNAIPGNAIPGN